MSISREPGLEKWRFPFKIAMFFPPNDKISQPPGVWVTKFFLPCLYFLIIDKEITPVMPVSVRRAKYICRMNKVRNCDIIWIVICHKSFGLTAHNWQKWKRVFLTCPCHKIYRDEAVGLKSCKYIWKIMIFVKMWNLGQFLKNLIFCQ